MSAAPAPDPALVRSLVFRRELLRRAAVDDLLAFAAWTLPDYRPSWHHRLIAARLGAVARGEIRRLIVCCPPRRGKSELVSRRFPAWLLGRNPDLRVIACSYGADLSIDMSRDCQRIIEGERYQELFPGTQLSKRFVVADSRGEAKRTADQWEIVGHRGGYLARGIGGGITGKGCDVAIIDDVFKDAEAARSPRIRDGIWEWYTRALRTRLAPGGAIVVVMTRWHHDDLVGRLLAEQASSPQADRWEVVELREIREDEVLPDDPRRVGEVLWPERFGLAEALSQQAADPHGFAALYQQRPSLVGGSQIRSEWLQLRHRGIPSSAGDWIQSWDCRAGGRLRTSDWAVGQVWFRCLVGGAIRYYLVDQVRGRWDLPATIQEIRRLRLAYPQAGTILVEDQADGREIVRTLGQQVAGIVPVPAPPGGDKISRLISTLPAWEAGGVVLPASDYRPWVHDLEAELLAFPAAAHDDQVDAASQALRWYADHPPQTGPVYERIERRDRRI